jgi:hypothetical protein
VLTLEITVDRLGYSDDGRGDAPLEEVLGEHGGVRIRVVAPDDDQTVQPELATSGDAGGELLGRFNLVPARADHVESTRVTKRVDRCAIQFRVTGIDDSPRPPEEPVDPGIGVKRAQGVEQPGDHVVTSGSLPSAEHDPGPERPRRAGALALGELDDRPRESSRKLRL